MRNHRASTFSVLRYDNTQSENIAQGNTTESFWASKRLFNPVKKLSNAIGKRYGWLSTLDRDFHRRRSLGNSTQRYADGHDTIEVLWQRKSSTTVTTISIPFSFDGPNVGIPASRQAGYECATGVLSDKIDGVLRHRRNIPSITMQPLRSNAM